MNLRKQFDIEKRRHCDDMIAVDMKVAECYSDNKQ